MVFTLNAAGAMAQVLAMLLIAAAFAPLYKGIVYRSIKLSSERLPRLAVRLFPMWIVVVQIHAVLFVVLVDGTTLLMGRDVGGVWGFVLIIGNVLALISALSATSATIINHAFDER